MHMSVSCLRLGSLLSTFRTFGLEAEVLCAPHVSVRVRTFRFLCESCMIRTFVASPVRHAYFGRTVGWPASGRLELVILIHWSY